LTSTLYLEEVLDRILENLEQVVLYDKPMSSCWTRIRPGGAQHLTGQGAKTQPELQSGQPMAISSLPFLALMFSTRSYLLSNNIRQDPCWREQPEVSTLGSYLGTPISFQNQIVGFISIYSVHLNQYDEVDAERLQIFASHAAIAIQNAQMHKESRHLATLQERQRLARELHDSVSQTLFTSSVMAESALLQWDENAAKARTLLADVLHLTKSALAEMRVLLLELRPKALEQMSLTALIELLAQAVQGRNMIEVVCKFGDTHVLPPAVKVGLYRITQEALNNVIKHSTATRVDISADVRDSTVLLQIRDNGQGFERHQVSGSSLGLGIMKERAEEIHAKLRIDSAPGSGTTVQVAWNAQSL
jgi:signal transduction histidine kinase